LHGKILDTWKYRVLFKYKNNKLASHTKDELAMYDVTVKKLNSVVIVENATLNFLQNIKSIIPSHLVVRKRRFRSPNFTKLWANHLRGLGNYKDILGLPDHISELIRELNQWLDLHLP
jgi:hypothetical protein